VNAAALCNQKWLTQRSAVRRPRRRDAHLECLGRISRREGATPLEPDQQLIYALEETAVRFFIIGSKPGMMILQDGRPAAVAAEQHCVG
jgi:hypothetical protein